MTIATSKPRTHANAVATAAILGLTLARAKLSPEVDVILSDARGKPALRLGRSLGQTAVGIEIRAGRSGGLQAAVFIARLGSPDGPDFAHRLHDPAAYAASLGKTIETAVPHLAPGGFIASAVAVLGAIGWEPTASRPDELLRARGISSALWHRPPQVVGILLRGEDLSVGVLVKSVERVAQIAREARPLLPVHLCRGAVVPGPEWQEFLRRTAA